MNKRRRKKANRYMIDLDKTFGVIHAKHIRSQLRIIRNEQISAIKQNRKPAWLDSNVSGER